MDPVEISTLQVLDFEGAASAEAVAWRNLLPPEPWQVAVSRAPKEFGDYAKHALEVGRPSAASVVSRARKPHQQTRPVAVMGIAERIAYRALSEKVTSAITPADRSHDAYEAFIAGPIMAAVSGGSRILTMGNMQDMYVVESDVASFYEYIDHHKLLGELQLRAMEVEHPRVLIRLLDETQGRTVGLPQLLDPSDELSEVYARIIERELKRRGFDVWRYNDDFRMLATGYDHAQSCLEALAREADRVGLVLNERKTRVVKLENYLEWNFDYAVGGDVEFQPSQIRLSTAYGELSEEGLSEVAHGVFDRIGSDADYEGHIDVANPSSDEIGDMKVAVGIVTSQSDAYGMGYIEELFEFAPYLSHRLGAYMMALHEAGEDISPIWDALVGKGPVFNAWQRVWLVYVGRVAGLLTDAARSSWVNDQRSDPDPLLCAEACLAVAPQGYVTFDQVDGAIRTQPEVFIPWYALAARLIPNVNQSRLKAILESDPLIDLLVANAKATSARSKK